MKTYDHGKDEVLVGYKEERVLNEREPAAFRLPPHRVPQDPSHPESEDHDHLAGFALLVTRNQRMRELFRYAERIALSSQPILIAGETGVGKELMARAIHNLSGCKGELISLNVAGLDDTMFSDALFGHRKGAYTGADQAREGLVARAARGTLFLDEIGDLNEMSQIKLLRLLQEKEYYPVGSDIPRVCAARILVATNCDLHRRMEQGRFRPDLFYRISVHKVVIPPLRERKDDLPLLLEHFIAGMSKELGIDPPGYPERLVDLLQGYDFPGNVRELEGMVDDAVVCSRSGTLSVDSFLRRLSAPPQAAAAEAPVQEQVSIRQKLEEIWGHFPTLREMEELLIGTALDASNGNQRIAAAMLGLNRQTLNMRLQVRKRSLHPPILPGTP